MGAVDDGLLGQVSFGTDEDQLRSDLDVEAGVVEVEDPTDRLRRVHPPGRRQLHGGLAQIAIRVRLQVTVVDARRALYQHADAAVDPRSRGIGEEQGDAWVARRV